MLAKQLEQLEFSGTIALPANPLTSLRLAWVNTSGIACIHRVHCT